MDDDRLNELKDIALDALKEALEFGTVRDKMEATRLILQYTTQKPAIKSEVQVTDTNATHLAALMKYGSLKKDDFMTKVKLSQQKKIKK